MRIDAADRKMADHDFRADIALGERRRRDAAIGNARPYRAIGELPRTLRRRQPAQARARAGGVDDEIETGRCPRVLADQPRAPIGVRGDIDDPPAGFDCGAAAGERLPKRAMQRGAMNADGVEGGIENGIAEIEDQAAAFVEAVQPIDARAQRFDRAAQAEPLERGKAGRLQHQAGAERARRGEALVEDDAMAGAA